MTCFLQYLYMKKPTICNLANDLNRHGNHLVLPMENKMEVSFMFLFQDEKNKNLLNPINYAFFFGLCYCNKTQTLPNYFKLY